eukprot:232883-Amphidinium_carterae.1
MGMGFHNPRTQRREWELWEQEVQALVSEEDLVEVPRFIARLSQPRVQVSDVQDHGNPMLPVTRETHEDHPPASTARPEESATAESSRPWTLETAKTVTSGGMEEFAC